MLLSSLYTIVSVLLDRVALRTPSARAQTIELVEAGARPTVLLRDRDPKFAPAFAAVIAAQGVRVVPTPARTPRANAVAERVIGTVRRECLDRHRCG